MVQTHTAIWKKKTIPFRSTGWLASLLRAIVIYNKPVCSITPYSYQSTGLLLNHL
jgi:hypothetical protein